MPYGTRMELKGKNALVTGAGIRVGRAIALALGKAGANVVVHYGRSENPAAETAEGIRNEGAQAWTLSADLAQQHEVQALIPAACEVAGHLDVLVNSAALFTEGGLVDTTPELWDREMAINLKAPALLTRSFIEQLPAGHEGGVVNITDARINRPGVDHFAYRLTKGALADMTRNLALELAPAVRVNAVALGAVMPPPGKEQDHLDRIAQERVPLKRSGSAEGVAEQVLHLLRSDFLTGVVIPYDGGEFL